MPQISAYEPIYFLVGTDPEKSKFQYSFKYRFLNSDASLAKSYPWTGGLHFGYTQTSFWNLKEESLPFKDTSYKPEFFHTTTNIHSRPPWLQGFFIQSGVQHESNGQSEEFSRSTNVLYLKPIFIFYNKESLLGLGLAPKVWLYFDNSKTGNPYLADYRGYFELEARVGLADGFVVGSKFKWAKEGGSVQLDLTYPLHRILSDNLSIYLHIQYVNSLAENLLNYQDRTEALRIGFSFIR
ncbi:MAG: phospholipase A [Proteobacteria bacterium]|nr:phospholipase A [Pseudomonadota bacterium]